MNYDFLKELRLRLPSFNISLPGRFPQEIRGKRELSKDNKFLWKLFIYSQHYGLPTRLLDFTTNPLVALYFALREDSEEDRAVWCLRKTCVGCSVITTNLLGALHEIDPFRNSEYSFRIMIPPHIDKRIPAQSSVFVWFSKLKIPITNDHCIDGDGTLDKKFTNKLIISNNKRKNLLEELNACGINEEKLFPDLDHVCKHIKWETNLEFHNKNLPANTKKNKIKIT